jgi:hypothetical protein
VRGYQMHISGPPSARPKARPSGLLQPAFEQR